MFIPPPLEMVDSKSWKKGFKFIYIKNLTLRSIFIYRNFSVSWSKWAFGSLWKGY